MEGTPKVHKRFSLSLNRLNNRTQLASPQNRSATSSHISNGNAPTVDTPPSSSALSICSDNSVHTPPHRKLNLDDSMDYSPKCFDTSFSPSCLLSQTLAIDSPEVGWRWTEETSNTTPDSAYAGSSFTSVSPSTETASVRTRSDTQRLMHELRREEHRKAVELQVRRAEKLRADELLKKRCAKLQEQLKEAESQTFQKSQIQVKQNKTHAQVLNDNKPALVKSADSKTMSLRNSKWVSASIASTAPTTIANTKSTLHTSTATSTATVSARTNKKTTLDDFLNDSETDGFLLKATQELEQMVELTQKPASFPIATNTLPSNTASAAITTPTSSSKEKRSSFYMKFLDEDSSEDWFESLDEVVRQAMQAKKPRKSFQRYNSMPVANTSTVTANAKKPAAATTAVCSRTTVSGSSNDNVPTTSGLSKMKRHASTHALSPSGSSSSKLCSSYATHSILCRRLVRNILQTQCLRTRAIPRTDTGFRRESHAYKATLDCGADERHDQQTAEGQVDDECLL